jgi:hypothetical protein
MPKPNRGKTQTVKKRAIYVYLPSIEMVEDWKQRVAQANTSISKFVIEKVEDSIRRDEGEAGSQTRLELINHLSKTEDEVTELRSENRLLRQLVNNLDNELKRFRAMPFLDDEFQGVRRFDKELIDLLRRGETYTGNELLTALNINPSDTDLIKAVNKQLEVLESYGLVEYLGRGWKWAP